MDNCLRVVLLEGISQLSTLLGRCPISVLIRKQQVLRAIEDEGEVGEAFIFQNEVVVVKNFVASIDLVDGDGGRGIVSAEEDSKLPIFIDDSAHHGFLVHLNDRGAGDGERLLSLLFLVRHEHDDAADIGRGEDSGHLGLFLKELCVYVCVRKLCKASSPKKRNKRNKINNVPLACTQGT